MTLRDRVVVIGANGQVGSELVRAFGESVDVTTDVTALTRRDLDLTDSDAIARVLRSIQPTVICNAAAYTAVDAAEREPALAHLINCDAVGAIGQVAAELKAGVVHFSSDYVFDGMSRKPYREYDVPNPVNVYGESKLAGERALAASGAAHLTVRTSWIYSKQGHNFLRSILRLAQAEDTLRVIDDQFGCPTWARWLARATVEILTGPHGVPRAASIRDSIPDQGALLHLAGGGIASWYDFAVAILDLDPQRDHHRTKTLTPIRSDEYLATAVRPTYSALDCRAAESRFSIALVPWRDQLATALDSGE